MTKQVATISAMMLAWMWSGAALAQSDQPKPTTPAPAPAPAPAKPEASPKVPDAGAKKPEAAKEEKPAPGLKVGDAAPGEAMLMDVDEKPVKLKEMWKEGPVVVTFYRGGWCPFCTRSLAGWQKKMDELKTAGARFVAITPETPKDAKATKEQTKLEATVLVDSTSEAGKGFKVHFEMDPETQKKYQGFGLDLAKRNQNQKWELDAPATFVIDEKGVVRYAFADWDYTKRADPEKVIATVKEITSKK